jgi:hypothetical protein
MNSFETMKNTLKSYLNWAKTNPNCATAFYTMAQGFAMGAVMALAACNNDMSQEIEDLWNNELDPAFKALVAQ